MTVGLTIKVERPPSAGGASSYPELQRIQQTLEREAKALDQLSAKAKQFGSESAKATATLATGLSKASTGATSAFKKAGQDIRGEMDKTAKDVEKTFAGLNPKVNIKVAFAGINAGLSGALTGVKQSVATLGSAINSSISTALSGGLLNGNLFRAGGELASGLARAGGQLATGIASGIGSAAAGAAGAIGAVFGPGGAVAGQILGSLAKSVTSAFGAALSIVGELGSTLAGAAGQIAGFLGDKIGLALKVSLGAGIGLAVAGLSRAIDIDKLTPQFEKFAEASGTTVPEALAKLQSATDGAVSKIELMRLTNVALTLGVNTSVDQFAQYAGQVADLGDAFGKNAAESVEIFVRGVAGLSEKTLRQIGINVDFQSEIKKTAAAMDRSVESFTEAEKIQIALATAVGALDRATAGNQGTINNLDSEWDKFLATGSDFITGVAEKLAPAFSTALQILQPLIDGIAKFLNGATVDLAGQLADGVGTLAGNLAEAGKFIGNLKLDEAFELGRLAADEMWIRIKQGAEDAGKFLSLQFQAAWRDIKGFAIDALSQIAGVALGALGPLAKAFGIDDISKVLGGARADELHSEASSLRSRSVDQLGDSFVDTPAIQQIRERRQQIVENVNARPGPESSTTSALTLAAHHIDSAAGKLSDAVSGNRGSSTATPASFSTGTTTTASGAIIPPNAPLTESISGKSFSIQAPTPQAPGGLAARQGFFAQQLQNTVTTNFPNIDPEALATMAKLFASASQSAATFTAATDKLLESSDRLEADAAIQARKNSLSDEKAKLSTLDSLRNSVASAQAALFNKELDLIEREAQARQRIADEFEAKTSGIIENAGAQVQQALQSKLGNLQSATGSFEADDGIPLKLKTAARRAQRRANRERKHELNQELAGKGLTELSANGGEVAQQILARQAVRESGGAIKNASADALEQIAKASEARNEAEAKLNEEIQAQTDKLQSAFDKEEELLGKIIDQMREQQKTIEEHEASLKDFERAVSALRSG